MCYLVRQQQAETAANGTAAEDGMRASRPRWAGAAAAMLVAGLALAALVLPAGQRDMREGVAAAVPTALVVKAVDGHAGATTVRTMLPVDDGVPTAPDRGAAAASPCQHGL